MPTKSVVTRFAPSPTGFMHIGGVRTALFAYLLARKNNGTFILRIEDTDKAREVAGSIEHIQASLQWLGINWDFGPDKAGPFGSCIQSERLSTYRKYAQKLIEKGFAYPDPYTNEQVEVFRAQAEAEKKPFLFRNHRPETFEVWDGTKPLRFKVPTIKRFKWHDAVRGDLEAGEEALDDFILIKSDGYPTYNFAHIIDDLVMGVTHIIRGEEFISSTPRFLSLYEGLGIEPPVFVTVPPILGEDHRKKLGKRDGAKDILEYKKEGYIPATMVNFLAMIGWNPGTTQEIFSMKELINLFDLAQVQVSGGAFNEEKLDWYNREYILKMTPVEFATYATDFIPKWLKTNISLQQRVFPLIQQKITVAREIPMLFEQGNELAFVKEISPYDTSLLLWKKNPNKEISRTHLEYAYTVISAISDSEFTLDTIKNALWSYAETNGKGDVLWPLRVALTGQEKSPDPFVSATLVGKEESLKRIGVAVSSLSV